MVIWTVWPNAKHMRRGDTRPFCAYVEGFRKFDELGTGGVQSAKKNGHLNSDARRGTCLSIFRPAPDPPYVEALDPLF